MPEYIVTYRIETDDDGEAAASAPAEAVELTVILVDDPDEAGEPADRTGLTFADLSGIERGLAECMVDREVGIGEAEAVAAVLEERDWLWDKSIGRVIDSLCDTAERIRTEQEAKA